MIILLNEIESGWDENSKRISICRDNIYAGCVMKYKKGNSKPCRKILFYKNHDNTITDFLYDSPNYNIGITGERFYISDIVKLDKLLKFYNYSDFFDISNIRYIFNDFISKNAVFFKDDHHNLPLTFDEYATLEMLSQMRKRPVRSEKKEIEKFKTKIKTYTFK